VELSPTRNKIFSQPLHFHKSSKFLSSLIKKQYPSHFRNQPPSDVDTATPGVHTATPGVHTATPEQRWTGEEVEELRAIRLIKINKIVTNYASFCASTMLASKIITEIIEIILSFMCARTAAIFVSIRF